MRRLMAVTIGACLLVLVLAVPALAEPTNEPFGQTVKNLAQSKSAPFGDKGVSETARTYTPLIPGIVHQIKADIHPYDVYKNTGDFVHFLKMRVINP